MFLFRKRIKSKVGIDIGTSSIKVVQLKKEEDRFKLETYGELSTFGYLERLNDAFQTTSLKTLEAMTREMIKILLEKSEVTTKEAIMSIPVFSSFVSIIEMPEMTDKELSRAIDFEARRYVPIPLTEVSLDWKIIESGMIKDDVSPKPFKGKRVILIAVPREVVNKYINLANYLNLKIAALELESFSLARSLAGNETGSSCILDVGARATSFTIVDRGIIQMSHSLDVAGAEMTKTLATGLAIAPKRAEDFKKSYGLNHLPDKESRKDIKELLSTSIDKIIDESERMIANYQSKTDRKIDKLILNGGSAPLIGLKDYIEKKLNMKVLVADPWKQIIYPAPLQPILKEIGPSFSVAVGAAMRES